jgi:hypothetical protein
MKKLIATFLLCFSSFAFSQTVDRLTQAGCDFLAASAACVTEENRKVVEGDFCTKSIRSLLDKNKAAAPDSDWSMVEQVFEQEIKRVKSTKVKDAQKVFNALQDKCYSVGGDIKQLLHKEL